MNDLDVVIPTKDRPDHLAATLAALAGQDTDGFGVIVVDDGGATPAADLAPAAPNVRFVRNATSIGPGPSRNRGVDESGARCVVFLDDDCVAVPDLISRHRAALDGQTVSLGPILSPPGQRLPVWMHWDADRLEREYVKIAAGECAPEWHHLYTGNVGLRRADFLAVGGFDQRFSRQEDVELGYRLGRLGCRFVFDTGAVVVHHSDRSLASWLRIPAASARFDVLMDELVPDSARLAGVDAELEHKHPALRVARRAASTPRLSRAVVSAAVATGRALHAARVDRAALAAFSVVWDLTYRDALREARR